MRDPEQFDAFYKDARERLLVQTFALTGDLAASRRAVRDSFIVAWHHWRKNARLEDPETVVRPHAWRLAQRRHTARVWHRDKDVGPEVRAILDGLGTLSQTQRRTLVLTQLASVSMPQMAREVGLPLEEAERQLQAGATRLAMAIDVPTPALRTAFETVATSVAGTVRWPRATIVRRAGGARRRTHTTVGALAAAVSVVAAGAVLTDVSGARPTLDRTAVGTGARPTRPTPSPSAPSTPRPDLLPSTSLLASTTLTDSYPQRDWTVESTDDNSGDLGDAGLVVPCQGARYADPRGAAATVRVLAASATPKQEAVGATQLAEASTGVRGAERTFRTMSTWFAGCRDERVQLLATSTPEGVGDEAVQVVLRSWKRPVTTYVVGIARTGIYSTATFVRLEGDAKPDRSAAARVLAGAVDGLCRLPNAGACAADDPDVVPRTPLPVDDTPAMISEVDLPPLTGIRRPWVGTRARKAMTNDASSGCDDTTFLGPYRGVRFTNNATRTFVVPEADLSQEFGLTETVGSLPLPQARTLLAKVRERLADCSLRDLNTDVQRVENRDDGPRSLSAWRLDIDVSPKRTVTFWMAIVRDGTSIAQVGFLPDDGAEMMAGAFVALAERALDRLAELPGPRKPG